MCQECDYSRLHLRRILEGIFHMNIHEAQYGICGPASIVGGLQTKGIESRRGRDFPHLSRPALRPKQPPVQCVPVLSRDKERPKRDADTSLPFSAVIKKE